jgi:adenosylcobinamide amidohydrolase
MKRASAVQEAGEVELSRGERSLVVRFAATQRMCSWAIVNGGFTEARAVVWIEVRAGELKPPIDARRVLRARLAQAGAAGAVGLLTSRDVTTFVDVTAHDRDVRSRCIATVGLGNALRAGDPPGPTARIGTINLLCHVDVPLTDEALLEAMSIATEARTVSILDAAVPSLRSGLPATGTGTDCIVMATPVAGHHEAYAGKHTRIGHVVGAAVAEAVRRGAAEWKAERGTV